MFLVKTRPDMFDITASGTCSRQLSVVMYTVLAANTFSVSFRYARCSMLRQAKEAHGADNAVKLLQHLTAFINGLQDERV